MGNLADVRARTLQDDSASHPSPLPILYQKRWTTSYKDDGWVRGTRLARLRQTTLNQLNAWPRPAVCLCSARYSDTSSPELPHVP